MTDAYSIPLSYLFQIAEQTPRALSAYIVCFQMADDELSAFLTRDYIVKDRSMNWTKFRNDILALARIGLLEWHEIDKNTLKVILAKSEFDHIGATLC